MARLSAVRVTGGFALVIHTKHGVKYCMSKTSSRKEVEDFIKLYSDGNWFFSLDYINGKPTILSKRDYQDWETWKTTELINNKECSVC